MQQQSFPKFGLSGDLMINIHVGQWKTCWPLVHLRCHSRKMYRFGGIFLADCASVFIRTPSLVPRLSPTESLGTGLTYALRCRYDQHRRVQIEQIEVGESVLREYHMVQYINVWVPTLFSRCTVIFTGRWRYALSMISCIAALTTVHF